MIQPIDFYSMRLNECNAFGKRVVDQVKKFNHQAMGLQPLMDPLEATLRKFEDGLNRTSTKQVTLTVKEADSGRDSSVTGLVMYCKAYTYLQDEVKKEAANLLVNTLRAFGSIQKANYEEATSKVNDLLHDLAHKPPLTSAVETIQAGPFVEQIRLTQQRFDSVAEERLDVKSARPNINNQNTAKELKEKLDTLFQFLEVMQKIAPNPDFDALGERINTIIDETMNKVKIREGRRAAQKEG